MEVLDIDCIQLCSNSLICRSDSLPLASCVQYNKVTLDIEYHKVKKNKITELN